VALFTSFIFATMAISTQLTITNVVGFYYLYNNRPFQIGDVIKFNGKHYIVHGITLYAVSLVTTTHAMVYMPNAQFFAHPGLNQLDAFERRI
jgi:small-conductance mechanosensitive channel